MGFSFVSNLLSVFGLSGAATFFEAFEGRQAKMDEFHQLHPEGLKAVFHSGITPEKGLSLTYGSRR